MPKNYAQIINRLERIRRQTQTAADAVLIVEELPDGRYMRMSQDRNSSFWDFDNQPPGSTVDFNSLFIDESVVRNPPRGCAVIIDDISKILKENKNYE
ncbi:hypothetical protein DSECCO2_551970 [anaerobic digester metagenome]